MKKLLTVLVLLIVIFLSLSYIILKLLANGSEDNFFNTKYRAEISENPTLRKIIGLHFDGDAREDYLGDRYAKITIEIDSMQGLTMSDEAVDLLVQKIEEITGKEVVVYQSESIPYSDAVNIEDIEEIVTKHRNYVFSDNAAKLYVLYLSEFEDEIDHLGSTYQEYGILLFDTALKNLTENNPRTFGNYVESTALHEFGHQIGLIHNENPNCLMNEHAEQNHAARENPKDVVVDFCEYEKGLIGELK